MMQEMYEWYMDNLFPEHRRRLNKALVKDDKARMKRLERKGDSRSKGVPYTGTLDELWTDSKLQAMRGLRSRDAQYGKWSQVGQPALMSIADWAIIVNPWDVGPDSRKRRSAALSRQWHRYQEYSN